MTSQKRPLCYIPYVILSLWLISRVRVFFFEGGGVGGGGAVL